MNIKVNTSKEGFISYSSEKALQNRKLALIACIDANNGIGLNNELLFNIKEDLIRFKDLTTDSVVIMGRKTFESLPYSEKRQSRALPNRTNIVVSRNRYLRGAICVESIEEAINLAEKINRNIFFIGGANIYKEAMDIVDTMYLTEVATTKKADTFFPKIDQAKWSRKIEACRDTYKFVRYERLTTFRQFI